MQLRQSGARRLGILRAQREGWLLWVCCSPGSFSWEGKGRCVGNPLWPCVRELGKWLGGEQMQVRRQAALWQRSWWGEAVRWLARYTRLIVTLASLAESVQPDKSTAVLQVPGSDP